MEACNFDLFNTEDLYLEIFGFEESDSFSDTFDKVGIQGSTFILGIGPVFLFVFLFPFYIVIHYTMRYLFKGEVKNKCIKNFVKPKGFIVIFLIFMLEGCLELGMTATVCVLMFNWDRVSTTAEIYSTILAGFFIVALIVSPIYILITGVKYYRAKMEYRRTRDKKSLAR